MSEPKDPANRLTIYDVAREAGVAASTVSRAYSRPGRVHSDTAQRIFDAAERIGYRSGQLGRRDSASDTATAVGLIISDVTNPFYGEIIKGAYEAARDLDSAVVLSHAGETAQQERHAIDSMLGHVAGMVIASSRMTDSAIRMVAKQTTVVLLNRVIPEASCIISDTRSGVEHAVEHLATLGHTSILYLAGPATSWSDGVRWRALLDAGREHSAQIQRIGPQEPTLLAGFRATDRVRQTGATAVLAYNDALAIGVMKGLRAQSVSVPDQVSIIGFDNIIFDEIIEPGLTTIAAPLHQMGSIGVRNCLAISRGAAPSGETLVLPVHLVHRESTARRKRR